MGILLAELTGDATGGATILSYNLEMDAAGGGTGPWTEVQGSTTDNVATSITINYLTGGVTYYFRYRAKNVHDWGPYSNVSYFLMASRPD